MTRDEHRAKCIEANSLALARNMFPERNLQSLDELGPRLKECYLAAGQEGIDALHGVASVNPIEATEEMIEAGAAGMYGNGWNGSEGKMPGEKMKDVWRKYVRAAYGPMFSCGDLTNPPEKKP